MLPSRLRLTAPADFTSVMRRGVASGRTTVVVHIGRLDAGRKAAGLAVSRSVGDAVTRNLVKRRLRSIMADIVPTLPDGTGMVIRALPRSSSAGFDALAADVKDAAAAALRKAHA